MSATPLPRETTTDTDSAKATLGASATVLILTTVHHVYGAIRFATPWRHHVALVALPTLFLLWSTRRVYRSRPRSTGGTVAFWTFVIVTAVVPIALIGLFEGGYNPVVKNILYFGGASHATLTTLFPRPRYEMPSDVFFEMTGVAQFPAALWAIAALRRVLRARRG